MSHDRRVALVACDHAQLSITKQCRLVSIARSSFYYESKGESPLNLRLMRLIDEQFLETPFFGSRQMKRWLLKHHGHATRGQRTGALGLHRQARAPGGLS